LKDTSCTAIDDATRILALKVYKRHTEKNATNYVNYVIKKFTFRINIIRTDDGHEYQSKFHWHVEDISASRAGSLAEQLLNN